jgi:SAM-dependent methyltransferase
MIVGDAYGALVRAAFSGEQTYELIERDDGLLMVGRFDYLAPVRRWLPVERRMLRLVRGRVLDVGCGPGRVGLELQRRGHEVVGIDTSPGAIEVARERGLGGAHVLALEELDGRFGTFDTVVMPGNNFGLLGAPTRARRLLRRLHGLTSDRARILATTLDPLRTDDPLHLAYHARNRERGRPPGLVRLRVRYRELSTPWFEYLFATPEVMGDLASATGWRVVRTVADDGPVYVGVLEKA